VTSTAEAVVGAAFPQYWAALQSGDRSAAMQVATGLLRSGVPLVELLDLLVARAQGEVGRRWAADEWSVAQEHRATSIGEDVVAALAGDASGDGTVPSAGRRVLLSCVDGEWHTLPGRILTAALRAEGHEVTYLGASVPARHLTSMLHDDGPDVVALSCALPTALPAARRTIELARSAGIPVVVGGRGLGPQGRWGLALGASNWAADARTAATALQVPAFVDPAPALVFPDDAYRVVQRRRDAVVQTCMSRLEQLQRQDVDAYDERQLRRTHEDFGHITDFLAAALFVDDADIFTEFVGWLDALLVARGVPTATLDAGLALVETVLADHAGDLPRARKFLAAGRAALAS
jgi:methanogenic corrinoid protein MtbC1